MSRIVSSKLSELDSLGEATPVKNKKSRLALLATLGISVVILLILSVSLAIALSNSISRNEDNKSFTSLVGYEGNYTAFCKVSAYPTYCEATLNKDLRASNDSTVNELLLYTVDAATWQLWTVHELVSNVSRNGTIRAALEDCQTMLEDALSVVSDASAELATGNYEDAPTRLTTATTYNNDCSNGLFNLGTSDDISLQAVQWQARSADWQLANALSLTLSVSAAVSKSTSASKAHNSSGRKLLEASDMGLAGDVAVPHEQIAERGMRMLAQANVTSNGTTIVVSMDGTGNFKSIQKAVDSVPKGNTRRVTIIIRRGVYKEQVQIEKPYITLQGAGVTSTYVTASFSVAGNYTTFRSCTVCTSTKATGFIAQDISFMNTAGPKMAQAVAFRSDGDLSVFDRCNFVGYQDTLYVHTGRSYFYNCGISGNIDFIFGNGAAVFQSCNIYVQPAAYSYSISTITAHSRLTPYQGTGFVFNQVYVYASKGTSPGKTYMGRPWQSYARVVFLRSFLSSVVHVERWISWNGNTFSSLPYLGEYKSTGPGSLKYTKPAWVKPFFVPATALVNFKATRFINARQWVPTGVPIAA